MYAAESYFVRDDYRIWSRSPNSRQERPHPDSGVPHEVYHNSFALRQHREFSDAALQDSVNVGFFGDSFTENLRVPAPYSFTEPLDYLLNTSGTAFNVLNFGIDGYGTDQAFTYYLHSPLSGRLQHVFYVFCSTTFETSTRTSCTRLTHRDRSGINRRRRRPGGSGHCRGFTSPISQSTCTIGLPLSGGRRSISLKPIAPGRTRGRNERTRPEPSRSKTASPGSPTPRSPAAISQEPCDRWGTKTSIAPWSSSERC